MSHTHEGDHILFVLSGEGIVVFDEIDEAGIKSDSKLGKTWGKKGITPVVRTSGQRQQINAISAVSPAGKFCFALYEC